MNHCTHRFRRLPYEEQEEFGGSCHTSQARNRSPSCQLVKRVPRKLPSRVIRKSNEKTKLSEVEIACINHHPSMEGEEAFYRRLSDRSCQGSVMGRRRARGGVGDDDPSIDHRPATRRTFFLALQQGYIHQNYVENCDALSAGFDRQTSSDTANRCIGEENIIKNKGDTEYSSLQLVKNSTKQEKDAELSSSDVAAESSLPGMTSCSRSLSLDKKVGDHHLLVVERSKSNRTVLSNGSGSTCTSPAMPSLLFPFGLSSTSHAASRSCVICSTCKKRKVNLALDQCESSYCSFFGKRKMLRLDGLHLTSNDIPVADLDGTSLGISLSTLSLSGNSLGSVPEMHLPKLTRLNLSHNRLTEFPEEVS